MPLRNRKSCCMLCCAAALLWSQPVLALDPPSFDSAYGRRIMAGMTQARYLDMLHAFFNSQDADGDGVLTSADVNAQTQILAAEQRAQQVQQLMRKDLDGDGAVTPAETRRYFRQQRQRRFGEDLSEDAREALQIQSDMAADANRDGRVTLKEAYDFAASRQNTGVPPGQTDITAFAPAKKIGGGVPWDSVRATAQTFFASIDSNRDAVLSAAEISAVRGASPTLTADYPAASPAGPDCGLPKPSKDAAVALLSAYEAQALSSVTLGSQDVAVRTGTVDIAHGSKPLYVVITSFRPTIWRFTGDVARIERAVLIGESNAPNSYDPNLPGLAGATGLAAARISFPSTKRCLRYFSGVPSTAASSAAGQLQSMIGRAPDVMAAKYAVGGFSLPSGTIQAAERGPLVVQKDAGTLLLKGGPVLIQDGNDLTGELRLYYPGGIVSLDPKDVIGSVAPSRYAVLPNQAGLAQLVQKGDLNYANGEFQIRRKIRFPAELTGAHAARFLLLKGVPKPDGDPGHSCVISEETGQSLANPILCH